LFHQRAWRGTARHSPRQPLEQADTPDAFAAASEATGVPAELLVAISSVETGLQMVEGVQEFPGQPRSYGVMGLRSLERAAQLTGATRDAVRQDLRANVLGAAAVLAEQAHTSGIDTRDLEAWAPVVATYSGIEDREAAAEYVWYEVYAALEAGVEVEGALVAAPGALVPHYPRPSRDRTRIGDESAVWTASPNHNSRGDADVSFIVVHSCEGSYSGCWGWLANSASGVSAHYVVSDDGDEVRQLVEEEDRAWHIGASYDCDNNHDVDCWRNGDSMNTTSVGIEHAGYASQSSWNPGLIRRSAELACGVSLRHDVQRDSYHIVGHGQLQPWNRTDPGENWPWADYLEEVRTACGDGLVQSTTTAPLVIDSNNDANDLSRAWSDVSEAWWGSASVSGYWNTGYWVAPTEPVSDPARFWFDAEEGCYTVEAWWPAGTDRSDAITFLGYDAQEAEVGRVVVNQRLHGSEWNHLGDWHFSQGWSQVALSRWVAPGAYAVADAVRVTPCEN
jgi:N-acetyl-anhydromuramyl-L-alanine amidase AmpD